MKKVNIAPIQYKLNFPSANILQVRLSHDDLTSIAHFEWALVSSTQSTATFLKKGTTMNTVVDRGKVEITGNDYVGWAGDNNFPMTFIAKKLGVTIVN